MSKTTLERDLIDDAEEALRILRIQLAEVDHRSSPENLHRMSQAELQSITGLSTKIARALAPLVKETRAIRTAAYESAADMSFGDKAELLVTLYKTLPIEFQRNVLKELK